MTTTGLLIGALVYLLIGFILRNYSLWGKKYYTESLTWFTLLWILPVFGTVLFYVALALIFVCLALVVISGVICAIIISQNNKEDWSGVLIGQYGCFMKYFTPIPKNDGASS